MKQPVEIVEANRDKITFQYNAAGGRAHMDWGRTPGGGSWGAARYRSHYSTDGSMEITEDAQAGTTTFVIYMGGDAYSTPVIWRSVQGSSTTNEFLYLHRDYLGSIVAITDGNGAVKEKRHFDAWGNVSKLQDGSGAALSSFLYLQRGYTGHEHLQSVGLIHMNGRLYDPVLHRFLMPDNYVQDPFNSQNFNRYGYVLNNPLKYTDPSGELTEAQWDEALNLLYTTFTSGTTPNGGYIGGDMTSAYVFGSGDESFGYSVGLMNQFGAWGGGSGWAGSPEQALQRFNGGTITPGMVEGYYRQQWAGQYYNIEAGNASKGNGFYISATLTPANDANIAVTYTSYEKMARLMGMSGLQNGRDNQIFGTIGTVSTMSSVVPTTIYSGTKLIAKTANYTDDIAKVAKVTSRTATGLGVISIVATDLNYRMGNVSEERYYVQQAINIIGLFGFWGAGISIGLSIIDAAYGDKIEQWIRR